MKKRVLAGLLLLCAATAVCAVKMKPVAGCYLARLSGLNEIAPNVFADGAFTAEERERLLKDLDAARLRVEAFLGPLRAFPRVMTGAKFRGTVTHRTPLCDCITLGPAGRNVDVIAHEMAHTELTARIGHIRQVLSVPTWFDEGVAMHVDYRAPFGEDMYAARTGNGRTAPKLADIDTARKFHKRGYVSYLTARHEFERWYARAGRGGLCALFESLRAGGDFEDAYAAAVHNAGGRR
jgi:hypothetical protein